MSDVPALPPTELGQVAIRVHDVARATSFYRDQLGLPLLFATDTMSFFQCGRTRLMLSLPTSPELDHPGSILYYRVADLPASHAALVARGVTCQRAPVLIAKMPDHELWMSAYRDTEDNIFELMGEVRGA